MTQDELLTTAEAAVILRVSTRTLARLACQGVIQEYLKHPGLRGPRLFHRDEVTRVAVERGFRHVQEEEHVAEAG